MFHVQLRQFPNVSREFNLSAEDLRARILVPWLTGEMVQSGDRGWAPERARLTIYEGPTLRPEDMGMGRGWQNVTRQGQDVTASLLAQGARSGAAGRSPALTSLKARVVELAAAGPLEVREAVRLAGKVAPGARVSERLALAEQAIWELLHEGALRMRVGGEAAGRAVDPGDWQSQLLSWGTWGGAERGVFVEAA